MSLPAQNIIQSFPWYWRYCSIESNSLSWSPEIPCPDSETTVPLCHGFSQLDQMAVFHLIFQIEMFSTEVDDSSFCPRPSNSQIPNADMLAFNKFICLTIFYRKPSAWLVPDWLLLSIFAPLMTSEFSLILPLLIWMHCHFFPFYLRLSPFLKQ